MYAIIKGILKGISPISTCINDTGFEHFTTDSQAPIL